MKPLEPTAKKWDLTLPLTLIAVFFVFVLIHDLIGGTLFGHSAWDSYTLQALAWRDGHLGLGQNYSHLELAVFGGDWFVSFPPVPTLVMLPLTFLFGANTPNNLVMVIYALIAISIAYSLCRQFSLSSTSAAFWSVFAVMGCNLLWMSTNGGVWFQAQSLNFILCLGTLLAAVKNRRVLALALLALAVGCRPFSLIYFPALLLYFAEQDHKNQPEIPFLRHLLRQWKTLLIPLAIGIGYMVFNYARFQNPLEFGHNYLPEFTQSQHGQFSLSYLWPNLKNLLFIPITMSADGRLHFPYFNGFMFYLANPVFLVFFVQLVRDLWRKRITKTQIALCAGMLLNILFLAYHKTLGGWQFGARYTVDLIPFVLFYLLLSGKNEPKPWEKLVATLAIAFNLYGALAMTFLQG